MLGAGLLWFGWFGFNGGSALASGGLATIAFVTTNTGAAAGMVTWLILEQVLRGKPTAVGAATGAVAGLVGITPAAGFVT
ncbi:MAG: ammonia channel protein, partial [Snowella sp.]